MGYGTSNEDNVAQHNFFILEKCGKSISNNAEYYNESNDANLMDDYNTIHETEEPYAHINVENCDYDHTTNALTPGSDARKTENVYNKLKMDRPGDNVNEQKHGPNVVQISEDDYDTTSAIVTNGKDDVSDYNHIPRTAYEAGVTGDNIKGDEEGEYDAVNSMTFNVAQSDDSDYAHVNKDQIK
ncbi:hypothetical protein DPMN_080690 [Dreissena polymorpha]|uniref:Uncharacterized protein n=1 Tax=Dreissena polymorpha TaxID=45954 RepID=A0A9D3YWX1_DREPO|nr:hypothetical protein DPMN_080690 [Dreissena polymorpha]